MREHMRGLDHAPRFAESVDSSTFKYSISMTLPKRTRSSLILGLFDGCKSSYFTINSEVDGAFHYDEGILFLMDMHTYKGLSDPPLQVG